MNISQKHERERNKWKLCDHAEQRMRCQTNYPTGIAQTSGVVQAGVTSDRHAEYFWCRRAAAAFEMFEAVSKLFPVNEPRNREVESSAADSRDLGLIRPGSIVSLFLGALFCLERCQLNGK